MKLNLVILFLFIAGCAGQREVWQDRFSAVPKKVIYTDNIPQVGTPLITKTVAGFNYAQGVIYIDRSYGDPCLALMHETGHWVEWHIQHTNPQRWNKFFEQWASLYGWSHEDFAETYVRVKSRPPTREMLMYQLISNGVLNDTDNSKAR